MIKSKAETFNDGLVQVFSIVNGAEAGDKPIELLRRKCRLRYKERTVGMGRFYTALQAQARIDRLLRCQRIEGVSTLDIAIPNDNAQYRIVQVQYPEDVVPPVMDLTLERLTVDYRIGGVESGA